MARVLQTLITALFITFNLPVNSLRTGILNTKYDTNQQDESVHASLKELKRGLRDLNRVSKRLESLADKIPPLNNENARTMMYQAQNELSLAFQILSVELVDNVENQPWFQHSSERAQKLQLKKIKESIRAITRSKTVSSGKKVKSGNYKFMSEKEARRIRKPRKQLGNRFGNGNGNDGYF